MVALLLAACYTIHITQQKDYAMTLVVCYDTKKDLKAAVGQRLRYQETSMFGAEYCSTGTLTVAGRPHITGMKREFFAQVVMKDDVIEKVK